MKISSTNTDSLGLSADASDEKEGSCKCRKESGTAVKLRLSSDVPSCTIDEKGNVDSITGNVKGLLIGMRILRINGVSVHNKLSTIRRLLRRAHALSDEFYVEFEKNTPSGDSSRRSPESSILFSPSDLEEMKRDAALMEQGTRFKDNQAVVPATCAEGKGKRTKCMRLVEIANFLGVNESELLSDDDGADGTSSDDEPGWNGKEIFASSMQSGVNLPHFGPMISEMRGTTYQHRGDTQAKI